MEEGFLVSVTRLVLDVLKPHEPNALEFAEAIAGVGPGYHVRLAVIEVDESTETVQIEVNGPLLDFAGIVAAINLMAGSLHSIDEVEVRGTDTAGG